ncbi:hypothetical protein DFJ73DRAFT_95533 [Zopfochytrium polystomum]|nr:hypothetical protein DFJ73DRAFT_95533 [Zopfochytrium polystomum]
MMTSSSSSTSCSNGSGSSSSSTNADWLPSSDESRHPLPTMASTSVALGPAHSVELETSSAAQCDSVRGRCWCCWEETDSLSNPLIRACTGCKDPDLKCVHQNCIDAYINSLSSPVNVLNPFAVHPMEPLPAGWDEEDGRLRAAAHIAQSVLTTGSWCRPLRLFDIPPHHRIDLPPEMVQNLDIGALRRKWSREVRSSHQALEDGRESKSTEIEFEEHEQSPTAVPYHPPPSGAVGTRVAGVISPWAVASASSTLLRVLCLGYRPRRAFRRPSANALPVPSPQDSDSPGHSTLRCTRCTDLYSVTYLPVPTSHVLKNSPAARSSLYSSFGIMLLITFLYALARAGVYASEIAYARHSRHVSHNKFDHQMYGWSQADAEDAALLAESARHTNHRSPGIAWLKTVDAAVWTPPWERAGDSYSSRDQEATHYKHRHARPLPTPKPKLALMLVLEVPGGATVEAPLASLITGVWSFGMLILLVRCIEILRWLRRYRVKSIVGVQA